MIDDNDSVGFFPWRFEFSWLSNTQLQHNVGHLEIQMKNLKNRLTIQYHFRTCCSCMRVQFLIKYLASTIYAVN